MNRYGKRCVLYPRVSTEMQVDGYSLEGQKNMLTRFADREEMIVVDTYEDAGKSGKSIEGRPAFQKMLRDIEDGLDIDYILVYKLSRFGRNAADILNSLELVQSYGVNLICIEEGIDSSQTSGKLLISVLSAVAEIERENIIEQTMNGRREKARQGGWNGGFAPYGYTLEDNKLMIEETEAVAIRKIFELYTSSEIGLGGIANQLNLQGIRKIPRQNGTLEDWTGHFIKLILDNPVYCGKIAYGRRTKEKVKGTKNDYQMKRNDDYILTEGQHKGIVSEEVWEKAHAKRLRTGVKQPSKIGRDRVHLLSGLLKCPVCGSPMYTNKHAWTNKDGTYKEIYYYVCSRNRMVRGKHCEYKAMLKKTDIEPMVIEAIREIVRNEEYAQAIKKRIGVQIDTKAVDKELEGYQAKLKEVDLNKTRLEREIDSLPADAKYRERKLHDMTLRLDSLYDVIVELEEKIEDARLRRDAIKQQAITLENIYKIMVNFDCVYNIINDEEKRNVVTALIKEIEIYRNDESEYPLKRIGLNFPVFKDGGEVTELLWDKGNTVEAAFVLNGLYPIIVCEGDRYFAFHNDVRLFLQNAIIHNSNIKGITESIINRIKQDRELWKYRYDISFNLLVSCKATDEVLKLIDVEYVMDSALYGISFDRILQQFILAHQLPMDNLEEVCIHSSAVSLCLAQYANCIQYYAKESDYFEAQSINKKTKAEKYCLNVKNDIEQIILDIDFAAKAGFERGHKLFDEYLSGYNIEALLSGELNKETLVKAGYIFRCYGADYMDALTGNSNDYVYFVDGWLDASVSITSKEDIRQTFTFKWYNPDSLYAYIHQITEEKNLEKESFDELLNILLGMSAST